MNSYCGAIITIQKSVGRRETYSVFVAHYLEIINTEYNTVLPVNKRSSDQLLNFNTQ